MRAGSIKYMAANLALEIDAEVVVRPYKPGLPTSLVSCMYINTHWLEIQVERRESNISLDESVESTEDSEFDSEATVLHSKLTEEEREALKPRLKAGHHQLCFLLIFFSLQHYPIMGVDKILA